jgi:hypothetical protein
MFKIASLDQTCLRSPSQWEGRTDDNRPFYVRYRWGTLTVQLGERDADDGYDGEMLFEAKIGGSLAGELEWNEVEAATGIRMATDS